MPKSNRFKIHFTYTQIIEGRKVLRAKTGLFVGRTQNEAIKAMKVEHPTGKDWKVEPEEKKL